MRTAQHDKVAVVTGAARGVGRGIALVLGETGKSVYVTDCETRTRRFSDLPGTVEDTAEHLTERGGRGVPVPLDHTDDDAVAALFKRVDQEHGGLDLLVANAFNGNALPFRPQPFWDLSLDHWANMMEIGVRSHLVSARQAAPLLMKRRGLLVLTGLVDETSDVVADHIVYDLAVTSISRLARTMDHQLRPHGVTALAVSPGFTPHRGDRRRPRRQPPARDRLDRVSRAGRPRALCRCRRRPPCRPDRHGRRSRRPVRLHRRRA